MSKTFREANDEDLVACVLEGELDQFAELVARYEKPLLRVARSRVGCSASAEDVVQETFLAAFKSLHSFKPAFRFRTWLWTILLNQCRRHLKKRKHGTTRQLSDDSANGDVERDIPKSLQSNELPSHEVMRREDAAWLDGMLCQLSDVQSDALRLRFFAELKFHEIATVMNCSLSTAKNRVKWGLLNMARRSNEAEINQLTAQQPRERPRTGDLR